MATKKWIFPTTAYNENSAQNSTIKAQQQAAEKVPAQTAKQPEKAANQQAVYTMPQAPKQYRPSQTVKAYESQYNTMKTQAPVYDNAARKAQVDELLNKALNMGKFEYNALNDPIYQQYAREYTRLGKMAAEDVQGQAAALSGGFGNSYGATAGAQQYNQYMQQLANIIPELEDRAYNRHLNDQEQAWKAYSAMSDAEAQEYARYLDQLQQHNVQLDRAQQDFLNAYAQEYQISRDAASDQQWWENYNRGIYESDRAYNYQLGRDAVADQQWQDTFDWNKSRDERDYARDVLESDRNYNRSVLESDRNYDFQREQYARNNYEYDQNMAWAREQYERNLALEREANAASAQKAAAELAYKQYRDQIADQQWAAEQAEKQRQFDAQWGTEDEGTASETAGNIDVNTIRDQILMRAERAQGSQTTTDDLWSMVEEYANKYKLDDEKAGAVAASLGLVSGPASQDYSVPEADTQQNDKIKEAKDDVSKAVVRMGVTVSKDTLNKLIDDAAKKYGLSSAEKNEIKVAFGVIRALW